MADPTSGLRDDIALDDAKARLDATGLFDEVWIGSGPDAQPIGADRRSAAWLVRVAWAEELDVSDSSATRTVDFALWVGVRDVDASARFRRLCQAEAAALNALNKRPIGGFAMPSRCMLRAGQDDPKATEPEARVRLMGRIAYIVPDPGSHDTSDRT